MRILSCILLLILSYSSYAQFGLGDVKKNLKFAKNKFAKKAAEKSLKDLRSKIDTASINLAVSFADNAGKFEQNKKLSNLRTIADEFFLDDVAPDPLEKARESNEMGELFYSMNQFWVAQVWFLDAKLQFESLGEKTHPQYFKVIANIGLLYHTMGRYTLAEGFTSEALELRKKNLGEFSTSTAASLNNMAVLYKDKGLYTDAEKLFNQAIKIFATNNPEGAAHAIVLNNQAILMQIMGRLDEAEKIFVKSLQLAENNTSLQEKSNNYQRIMVNQALLYQEKGAYDQAEKIYLKAIEIKESRLKTKNPDYAHLLNNLASLYMLMGKYDQVEQNLKEALVIYEDKLGESHPSYASTLSNLANFYRYQSRTNDAKSKLDKVLSLRREIYGDDHPSIVQTKEDLAIVYWQEENIKQAAQLYHEVLDKELEFINTYFPPLTEYEKSKYWDKSRLRFLRYYAFVADNFTEDEELTTKMYEYHIATKALLLSISNRIREEILNGSDEGLKTKYLTWLDKKETLVTFYSYSKEELDEEDINIDQIEREANDLERELSSSSEIFRQGYSSQKIKYDEVKSNLKSGQAIVDIVQGYKFDKVLTNESQYYALVISQGANSPILEVLQNGDELEGKYFKYFKNSIRLKMKDEYSYDNYWKPIDQQLTGKNTFFVSCDGIYNQISINTLLDGQGKYLLDKYNIINLTNSKNVITYQQNLHKSAKNKHATLVGYPNYGTQGALSKLPGTKVEVDNVNLVLTGKGYTTDKYLTDQASEENIKYSYDPTILHIATHGYFLSDRQISGKKQVFGIEPIKASENPLLRSGLFLAGAESAMNLTANLDNKSSNNGILTAYEAMNMRLNNTEIVILSACETGLGDVKSGEGVYGLQRAFQLAGSETVLMSLWKVDDAATKDLMISFYREWLTLGNKHNAFRKAQLTIKNKYKDPLYWGAFVLIEN